MKSYKWCATYFVDMARGISENGAPISETIVEDVADEYDTDAETVRAILNTAQEGMEQFIGEYRESQVVAETDEFLITLSEWGFKEEAKDVAQEIDADLDTHVEAELTSILSQAHHAAFGSTAIRMITGFDRDEVAGATSASYPRIIRKPDDSNPTTGDVDVTFRIQYDHGYKQPHHFVARARATVEGDHGTLQIERTYKALADDNADEPRYQITVSSEAHHVESDTLVNDYVETWSLKEQIAGDILTLDRYDHRLRWWVHQNHTGDFEQEYRDMRDSIETCQECGAHTDHDAGIHVTQRASNQFDPSTPDVLCNHCYAAFLEESTTLSQQEAEVYALKDAGLTYSQIADSHGGVSRSQVGTVMGRVKTKREKAEEELQTAKRTSELIQTGN